MDFNHLSSYIKYLCDPISHKPLELVIDDNNIASLICKSTSKRYLFMNDIPDLRPESGIQLLDKNGDTVFSDAVRNKHNEVMRHYDQKPCHNFLELDNVPTGKWLRDPDYANWFNNIDFAVEVGAGKGAIAEIFKKYRGINLFCIDLAYGSLQYVRQPPLESPATLGSNLMLPLKDEVADLVVSHGVIHHTPDPIKCFMELNRVLKPGGKLFLAVYGWESIYRSLYFFVSPPLKFLRKLFGVKLGDLILMFTAFPFYYLSLWFSLAKYQKNYSPPKLRRSWEQMGDDFLTPFARFYMREEMISLATILGLELLEHEVGGARKVHFYWFKKPEK